MGRKLSGRSAPPARGETRVLAARAAAAKGVEDEAEAHRERARVLLEGLNAVARLRELDAETTSSRSRSGGT